MSKYEAFRKFIGHIAAVLLLFVLVSGLFGCTQERMHISDYQYMYKGILKTHNMHTYYEYKKDTLLGFGEYLYNSHLSLFPRETPSSLGEYYFYWGTGLDYDYYAIYFTCELDESGFAGFKNGIESVEFFNGETYAKPLYDGEHFPLPTYILQWSEVGKKREVLEYVMLDEENHTAVFVYTMSELERIEKNSEYDVTPSEMDFLEEDFSVYSDKEPIFDASLLEYLK